MRFACKKCSTRYSISDERVRGRVLKIRCKTCNYVMTVQGSKEVGTVQVPVPSFEDEAAEATSVSSEVVATTAPPLPEPAANAAEWYVSFDGEQEGPLPLATAIDRVRSELARGKESYCWQQGFGAWQLTEKVPEFAASTPPRSDPATRSGALPLPGTPATLADPESPAAAAKLERPHPAEALLTPLRASAERFFRRRIKDQETGPRPRLPASRSGPIATSPPLAAAGEVLVGEPTPSPTAEVGRVLVDASVAAKSDEPERPGPASRLGALGAMSAVSSLAARVTARAASLARGVPERNNTRAANAAATDSDDPFVSEPTSIWRTQSGAAEATGAATVPPPPPPSGSTWPLPAAASIVDWTQPWVKWTVIIGGVAALLIGITVIGLFLGKPNVPPPATTDVGRRDERLALPTPSSKRPRRPAAARPAFSVKSASGVADSVEVQSAINAAYGESPEASPNPPAAPPTAAAPAPPPSVATSSR